MCTSALFEDLIFVLINKDSGVNLKRMSVYVILVLVSNNSKFGVFFCYNINFFLCANLQHRTLEHSMSDVLVKLIYKDEWLHVIEPEVCK